MLLELATTDMTVDDVELMYLERPPRHWELWS